MDAFYIKILITWIFGILHVTDMHISTYVHMAFIVYLYIVTCIYIVW
jgi:hypothetical protein